jgi:hypothetical protein
MDSDGKLRVTVEPLAVDTEACRLQGCTNTATHRVQDVNPDGSKGVQTLYCESCMLLFINSASIEVVDNSSHAPAL